MQPYVIMMRLLCACLAAYALACSGTCAPEPQPPPLRIEAEPAAAPVKSDHHDIEAAEQRELEDERRERQKALAALDSYKTESCAAATIKMEAALRTGKGRWHERDAQGSLPADLLTRLVEAELWRDQAKALCAADETHRARFEELRLLMDAIWRYPVTLPREELDKRMAALG